MIIHEDIEINAPLPVVWRVFAAMEDWKNWNTVCESCCILDGEAMQNGCTFSFEMRPYYLPIKVVPTITKCEPQDEVIWEGKRFGVYARHSFIFRQKGDRVILTSSEEFSGPLMWASKLILIPRRLHRLTQRLMHEIKARAESCAAEPTPA
ncbi:MAG: SRPBCC domain-containing protein [Desulfobacterales bacterium]|nr:SRPBCC domain-containing protein [Desulfobacterales bacterium]